MLRELFKMIRDFFKSLFGSSKPTPPPPKPVDPTVDPPVTPPIDSTPTPPVDPDGLSDSAEIPDPDSITVSDPDTLVFIDGPPEDNPLEPPIIPEDPVPPTHTQRYTWCLDNGHSKDTAGKRSPIFDDGETQLFEYEFNRDIVVRIIAGLQEKGVAFSDLMPDVEADNNNLETRVNRANQLQSDLPKLYLSVHSNAGPAPLNGWTSNTVSGIETWYYYGSEKGKKMAAIFQQKLIANTGWKDRGIKTSATSPFYVLKKTLMPAILTENGFYNNKAQALELMKEEIRQAIADAHVDAIMEIEAVGL